MNEQQLPELPYCVAHIELGDDSENVFTADQMRDYARAALAANEKQPLHERRIDKLWRSLGPEARLLDFARAIEAAHGIKEKP